MEQIEYGSYGCESEEKFQSGYEIINRLKQISITDTLTGRLSFDENGNRVNYSLDVVELNLLIKSSNMRRLSKWNSEKPNELEKLISDQENDEEIMGNIKGAHLNVTSRIGPPYLDYSNNGTGNDRFKGFSKDLMDEIANKVGFTYTLNITEDGKYGNLNPITKEWNGLIRDLLTKVLFSYYVR